MEDSSNDAAQEHLVQKLPMKTSEKEIGQRFGYGHEFYFIFTRFLAGFNLILGILGFIGFGPNASRKELGLQVLFFTSFSTTIRSYWQASSILQTILFFGSGFIYFAFVRIYMRKRQFTHENAFVVDVVAAERINLNKRYGFWTKWFYRSISYFILFGLTALSIFITFTLQNVYKEEKSTNLSVTNFILVIFINISGVIFGFICSFLTALEKQTTQSGYKISHVLKIYFFKVASVFGLNYTTGVQNFCQGGYNSMLLLLMDLVVWNIVELVSPIIISKIKEMLKITSNLSDEQQKPEFDVACELIELFYRQFIVFSAVSVFPIVGLFAFVVSSVEYPLDKFKLLKICQKPARVNHTFTSFIVILLTFTALAALFSPYSILNLNRDYYEQQLIDSNFNCKVIGCYFYQSANTCQNIAISRGVQ
eukprot:NODE_311_length_10039_cov_0.864487.p3 type:complete len:422 gc:universal NODE_311_length_10039_cov_0.864487:795-2060(+)